jgi:serine protease
MVELYSREPDVEYAELNYYACAFFVPNDPYYTYQWHLYETYAGVNIEPAWDITTGNPDVIVAVLDTGVAYENFKGFQQAPDLANTLFVPGYDFVNNDSHPNDDDAHGTHVTGTIAQSTNNGLGAAGIAFHCSIMPVKVLNRRGEAPYATIADGVYFAADNGANIINLSLGGPADSTTLRDAVAYAYNHGVTIICAAGNEYEQGNPVMYPAAYDEYCIAVGATRYDRTRAYYSNTGSYLDLVAPGGDLNVDQNADGYGDGILQQTFGTGPKDWGYWFYTGTSMAAPHVSGVAALLISAGITDPDAVREALQNTATDSGPAGWDEEYGWGLIDAYAALNYHHDPADFNSDGFVDFEDLDILSTYWLLDNPLIDIAPPAGDGIINFLDFAEFAQSWN